MFGKAQATSAVLQTMSPMNSPAPGTRASLLAVVAICAGLVSTALVASAWETETQFSGRATGVFIHTAFFDTAFADTGDLPPGGGTIDATVVQVDTSLAAADVLVAVTMGFDEVAQSEAAVASVHLLPGTANEITADFVRAQSTATCSGVSGVSEIASLAIGGNAIVVGTAPNQVVNVPGVLTLVINEQTDGSRDGTFDITVNALDLTLVTGERVIVSHAHSDIRCGRAEPSPKDFVNGGGFIDIAGGKANFGFVAGFKPHATAPSCQFTYIDHDAGIRVKMTDITDYGGSGTTRTFKGTAMVNGALDTATITVYDGGEPGRGVDTFRISLDSGYVADGTLAGGNIQLHA